MAKLNAILEELSATKKVADSILKTLDPKYTEDYAELSTYKVEVIKCDAKEDWSCDIISIEDGTEILILHLHSKSIAELRQSMKAFLVGVRYENVASK